MSRQYDIVVLGATGFYGRRCVQKLLVLLRAEPIFRVAVAGRTASTLRELVQELEAADRICIVEGADAASSSRMDSLAASTTVLLSAASGFMQHGENVIRACVQHGTHYFDISMEVNMTEKIKELHNQRAKDQNCVICPGVGFNFALADLATFHATSLMRKDGCIPLAVESALQITPGDKPLTIPWRFFEEMVNRFAMRFWARGPTPCETARKQVRSKTVPGVEDLACSDGLCIMADCNSLAGIRYNQVLEGWTVEGNGCESAIVHQTQAAMAKPILSKYAAFYRNMVALPSSHQLCAQLSLVAAACFRYLCVFALGRWLIMTLARLFGGSRVTRDDAVFEDSVKEWKFDMVFSCEGIQDVTHCRVGRQWGKSFTLSADSTSAIDTSGDGGVISRPRSPRSMHSGYIGRKQLVLLLKGPSPLYDVTPLALALAGVTCLRERKAMPMNGFCTPAIAFSATSFFETLKSEAGIEQKLMWCGN